MLSTIFRVLSGTGSRDLFKLLFANHTCNVFKFTFRYFVTLPWIANVFAGGVRKQLPPRGAPWKLRFERWLKVAIRKCSCGEGT